MTVNENNYIGATITLVGYVAVDPRFPLYDKEGKRGFKEIPVAISEGYKKDGEWKETGTTWYNIDVHEDTLDNIDGVAKGAKIRVDNAKQEVREYTNKDGESKLGITLRYGEITVLEPAGGGSPKTKSNDDWSDEAPF